MQKISGIYKITNTATKDFYIGSSKDVKQRWRNHKKPSVWNRYKNSPMYQDMQKYGVDKFEMQILAEVEPDSLKEAEQKFIETLKPTYNQMNAKGRDVERRKEYNKEYHKQYNKTDKYKQYHKEYQKTDKCKKAHKEYYNQLCFYNGETLTLCALQARFRKMGLSNPTTEAKKYLV